VDVELTLVGLAGESPPDGVTVTATFGSDGEVVGSGGCNRYAAPYRIDGGSIGIGPVLSTRMACQEPAMGVETRYFELLESAASWTTDGQEVIVVTADGEELILSSAPIPSPDAVGVEWRLLSIDGEALPADVSATLALFEDGRAAGLAGCNLYEGPYELEGDAITFGPIATTRMMCEPSAMEIEQAFLAALGAAARWTSGAGGLTMTDGEGGNELVFTSQPPEPGDAGAPVGPTWSLVSIGADPVPDGVEVTLTFDESGELGGSAGCNTYGASYTIDGGVLEIGPVRSTMMACEEPAMGTETAYLTALGSATSWEIDEGRLVIGTEDGTSLVFEAAAPEPTPGGATGLVGTTWSLVGIAGVSMPMVTPPRLLFEASGTLSGDTGCNTFSADYAVDDGTMSIGDVAATERACDDMMAMAVEQSLLQMLPFMTAWRIEGDTLTLSGEGIGLSMTFEPAT
jgi:heat shock protein HslJ